MSNDANLSKYLKFDTTEELPIVGEPNTIYIVRNPYRVFIWQDTEYLDSTPKLTIHKDQDSIDLDKAKQLLEDIKSRDNMIYSLLVKLSVKENYFIPFISVLSFAVGILVGYHIKFQ